MSIAAINDNGKPTDWWFAYKLPKMNNPLDHAGATLGKSNGTEYLYCDDKNPALPKKLSLNKEILKSGALVNTLQQLRDAAKKKDKNIGWFFYNDEYTKTTSGTNKTNNQKNGHTKGVLAFDIQSNTAFWILHSWPCYPSIKKVKEPSPDMGQTFLCITLKNIKAVDDIAAGFHLATQPQIIEMSLPKGIDAKKYPNIIQLAKTAPPAHVPSGASLPETIPFSSKKGQAFLYLAKSKDWKVPAGSIGKSPEVKNAFDKEEKDLYSDHIGPTLKINLEVETWQIGEKDNDSDRKHSTNDIQWVDLRALDPSLNYAWHFLMHDHAKWAISKNETKTTETDWVIVADINRIDTQYNRGGGGIAFKNKALAHSLHTISKMVPPAEDEKVIGKKKEEKIKDQLNRK